MADLSVKIAGVEFKNPIIPASGVFGYGREFEKLYPLEKLGGIATKGTTITARHGNPSPRIAEMASGTLNSVGLENPGIDHFIDVDLPYLMQKNTVIISNIAGSAEEEYVEIAKKLDKTDVHMIELNVSCPNVKKGGASIGISCKDTESLMKKIRQVTNKPVIVKLTPNVTDICEIAKAAESGGADAVSLINTVLGMRIDINTRRPVLKNNTGGMSGPAVFPLALRMVWQVSNAVKIPIIGMGGVMSGNDAIEMMIAGASAIQVGAAVFSNPYAPLNIINEMNIWLDNHNIKSVNEIIGSVNPW